MHCLYHLLLEIMKSKFPVRRRFSVSRVLSIPRSDLFWESDDVYLEMFVLGGLEAVNQTFVQPSIPAKAQMPHLMVYYINAWRVARPITDRHRGQLVPLSKPFLERLDYGTARRTCLRLPIPNMLFKSRARCWGKSWYDHEGARGTEFLEYLATHEGGEPKLWA